MLATFTLNLGGIVGLVIAAAIAGFGCYLLHLARPKRPTRGRAAGLIRSKLEASLLVGPQAEWWYRRVDATRAVNVERHRWRSTIVVVCVASWATALPFSVATAWSNRFGYNDTTLGPAVLTRAAVLTVLVATGIWGTRRVTTRWETPGVRARIVTRTAVLITAVGSLVGSTYLAATTAGRLAREDAGRPALAWVVELVSGAPVPEPIRFAPIPLHEMVELVGDRAEARSRFEALTEVAAHDLLLLDPGNSAGQIVIFDRTDGSALAVHRDMVTIPT